MMQDNTAVENLIGARLNGRYALNRILGAGGMGAVYLANDGTLDREVAIKVILPSLADAPADRTQLLARFWREARISAGLKHRNIVEVLDFGEDAAHQMPFLVMELLIGRDLETAITRERRLPARRAVHILVQVCRAIAVAHGKKQIHRDLKPSNIFIVDSADEPDFTKVLDFGLARDMPDGASDQPAMTQSGAIMGTVLYMAPEQIEAGRGDPIDHRCDIYALGCVAYHALTGRPPFSEGTVANILHAHLTRIAEPVHKLVPEVPRALSDVIAQALAKRPGHRPPTMVQLRDALEGALRPPSTRASSQTAPATPAPAASPPGVSQVDTVVDLPAVPDVLAPYPEPESLRRPAPTPIPELLIGARHTIRDAPGPVRHQRPVAAVIDGCAIVAYESDVAGVTRIHARRIATDLSSVDEPVALTAAVRPALAPAICQLDDGLAMAWIDARPDEREVAIAVRLVSAAGVPAGDPREITSRGLVASLSLCRLPSGKLMLAWTELGTPPQVNAIIARASELAAREPGRESDASARPAALPCAMRRFGAGSSAVLAASSAGAALVWHDAAGNARLTALGGSWNGGVHEIAHATYPVVAELPDRRLVAAWWSGGPEPSIQIAHVASPLEFGRAFRVGVATSTARPPAIAVAGGHVLVCHVAPRDGRPHLQAAVVTHDLDAVSDPIDLGPYDSASRPTLVGHRDHWLLARSLGSEIQLCSLRLATSRAMSSGDQPGAA